MKGLINYINEWKINDESIKDVDNIKSITLNSSDDVFDELQYKSNGIYIVPCKLSHEISYRIAVLKTHLFEKRQHIKYTTPYTLKDTYADNTNYIYSVWYSDDCNKLLHDLQHIYKDLTIYFCNVFILNFISKEQIYKLDNSTLIGYRRKINYDKICCILK